MMEINVTDLDFGDISWILVTSFIFTKKTMNEDQYTINFQRQPLSFIELYQ